MKFQDYLNNFGKMVPKNAYMWTSQGAMRLIELYNHGAMMTPENYEDLVVFPEGSNKPSVIPNPFRNVAEDAVINALRHGYEMALKGKPLDDVIAVYKNKGSLTGIPTVAQENGVAKKQEAKEGSKGNQKEGNKNEKVKKEDSKKEVEHPEKEMEKYYALRDGSLVQCNEDGPGIISNTNLCNIIHGKKESLKSAKVNYKPSDLLVYLTKNNEYHVLLSTESEAIKNIEPIGAMLVSSVEEALNTDSRK